MLKYDLLQLVLDRAEIVEGEIPPFRIVKVIDFVRDLSARPQPSTAFTWPCNCRPAGAPTRTALYPNGSEEKRLLDARLLEVPR